MIHGKRVCVVMPAYKAGRTLEQTLAEIDRGVVDDVVVVDDHSPEDIAPLLKKLKVTYAVHRRNLGYGGNQKTCYALALALRADITVMVHPDYQYDPKLVPVMAYMLASGLYDVVLASRILGTGALKGGMPRYKYVANRLLTAFQNLLSGQKLSEYHTGYRAFTLRVLEDLPLLANSDDFVFDNQMLAQCITSGYRIGETSCPTKYFPEASSINFVRSCRYGLGVVLCSVQTLLGRLGFSPANYLRRHPAQGIRQLKLDTERLVSTNFLPKTARNRR
jgi:glycosyltransferase involved in cell wall biosynthesis